MALTATEMLLKNLLGIDPQEMQRTVLTMINQVKEMHGFMAEIRGRLDAIEATLNAPKVEPLLLPSQSRLNGECGNGP